MAFQLGQKTGVYFNPFFPINKFRGLTHVAWILNGHKQLQTLQFQIFFFEGWTHSARTGRAMEGICGGPFFFSSRISNWQISWFSHLSSPYHCLECALHCRFLGTFIQFWWTLQSPSLAYLVQISAKTGHLFMRIFHQRLEFRIHVVFHHGLRVSQHHCQLLFTDMICPIRGSMLAFLQIM